MTYCQPEDKSVSPSPCTHHERRRIRADKKNNSTLARWMMKDGKGLEKMPPARTWCLKDSQTNTIQPPSQRPFLFNQIENVYPVIVRQIASRYRQFDIQRDAPSPCQKITVFITEKSINKSIPRSCRGVVAPYLRYPARASVHFKCCGACMHLLLRGFSPKLYVTSDAAAAKAILLSLRSVVCTVRRAMISPCLGAQEQNIRIYAEYALEK